MPTRRPFLDTAHPFFRPLWVRIAVVAAAVVWGLFEFVMGSPFWGVIFLGLGLYAAWEFIFAARPDAAPKPDADEE